MTKEYDRLTEHPRTAIDHSNLNYDERAQLRKIKVTKSSDMTNKGGAGRLTTIYYLEGDKQEAAEVFVEENRDKLETIDFSRKDPIQRAVSREVYDWILHALGEREIEKYDSVVREVRPAENVTWVIGRAHYEEYPMRRYSTGEEPSVRVEKLSLDDLYESFDDVITWSDLGEHNAIEGDARYILDYYRVSKDFTCDPVSHDGEMAIQKRHQ
ncbi:hypothetical protein CP556_22045 [Natrinema sp. CBA1119]|uniref:hypothetical protein n=1 Tax=Natrinema sp. CBA1119 TaxID=1608465 RepID=UPI000BF91105|nr:hypothetical protein [Natrinema sp. CBA1119]PGF14371.1 hypothetical protein CP556_22045 [Natrinema sp. CBA1119]